jgi:hypothetical protein
MVEHQLFVPDIELVRRLQKTPARPMAMQESSTAGRRWFVANSIAVLV